MAVAAEADVQREPREIDGAVVQRKDLTLLRETESRELETAMAAVAGSRPGAVDVRFDDYHLERRKD